MAAGEDAATTFLQVRAAALGAAGRTGAAGDDRAILAGSVEGRPRLTEPWFC